MSAASAEVWVLWSERFDEATAALFVTEFRAAGLRTRLVSLAGRAAIGAHGLALVSDWTLEEALAQAQDVACIVIPAQAQGWQRMVNDPRVNTLFELLGSGQPALVIGPPEAALLAQRVGLPWESCIAGPGRGEAARQWAQRLLAAREPAAAGLWRRPSGQPHVAAA
jgi:hypothetical protein